MVNSTTVAFGSESVKEDFKLRLLIDVSGMFARALVSDSLLHMLPY